MRTHAPIVAVAIWMAADAGATWSIVITDSTTREVAVGTVTCLTSFDLLALVPVVVVGEGGAAVQAAGDFDGIRRPIIFQGFMQDTSPGKILLELSLVSGHQSRQYGIVDTCGEAVTFSGTSTMQWSGGVIGSVGSMSYAIQGNILAGGCVVPAIEAAVLTTRGDLAERLMAGMVAARSKGGDGRCSCSQGNPTGCGCPPASFTKSGHIGCMVVARVGDTDDPVCNAAGCAGGDYYMKFNVPFQPSGAPDPVLQLGGQFNEWRKGLSGVPDAVASMDVFNPPAIPPNGASTTTLRLTLLDWQGLPVTVAIGSVCVSHAADSAGLSAIGPVVDEGGGVFTTALTAGNEPGVDRFIIEVDGSFHQVTLVPFPQLEYFALGDIDGDGTVGVVDLVRLIVAWGPCPGCPEDLDGNGAVDVVDLVQLVIGWG